MKFNFKKKTGVYIGRFQPFHKGHLECVKKILKKYNQIAILVMDSYGINKKNPFKYIKVKKNIEKALTKYKSKVKIIKIPVVGSFYFGRKVGYNIEKIKLPKNIENISATKIRNSLNFRKDEK